jgi:hypothetical protein
MADHTDPSSFWGPKYFFRPPGFKKNISNSGYDNVMNTLSFRQN